MKKIINILLAAGLTGLVWLFLPQALMGKTPEKVEQTQWHIVGKGDIQVWRHFSGEVGSERVRNITSKMSSSASLIELAKEGESVSDGDVLARFDSIELEQKVIKLTREVTLAETELESLVAAKLPLEIAALRNDINATQSEINEDEVYLKDSKDLMNENLISAHEVKKLESNLDKLKSSLEQNENKLDLTSRYLHPLAIKHATAKYEAASQALDIALNELDNTVIRAPEAGVVVLKPFHIGTEYRVVRVGDSIFPNQPFMLIPDMQALEIEIDVPEAELSDIYLNQPSLILPIAYPELRLNGHVSSISEAAQTVPGKPQWQRFFKVKVAIDDAANRLKSGMSVILHLLAEEKLNVITVPRSAIFWQGNNPFVTKLDSQDPIDTKVDIGIYDEQYYQIKSGLIEGERIALK